jgi:hypothetical protein
MRPTRGLQSIFESFREQRQSLPDHRRQPPSFLAHQRRLKKRKGREISQTLFPVARLPSDNQLRNLLDPVAPSHFQSAKNYGSESEACVPSGC